MEKNLIKESSLYKLLVPAAVESKIRRLLTSIYNIEWSGILFYTYEGTFANGDFKVICRDILPLDIGNGTFTQFEMSPTVISYMAMHDLLDCQVGLIHSHHSMATFFSGTDTNTLAVEGSERHNFVSLIVNNAGAYSAAVTWRVDETITGTKTSVTQFFGTPLEATSEGVSATRSQVHYAMLDVEVEAADDEFTTIISDLKKKKASTPSFGVHYNPSDNSTTLFQEPKNDLERQVQAARENYEKIKEEKRKVETTLVPSTEEEAPEIKIPHEIVNSCVRQLLTLSLTAALPLPIDVVKLNEISSVINKRVKERITDEDTRFYNTIGEYTAVVIQSMAEKIEYEDAFPEDIESALAIAVDNELEPYVDSFEHLKEVKEQLELFYL